MLGEHNYIPSKTMSAEEIMIKHVKNAVPDIVIPEKDNKLWSAHLDAMEEYRSLPSKEAESVVPSFSEVLAKDMWLRAKELNTEQFGDYLKRYFPNLFSKEVQQSDAVEFAEWAYIEGWSQNSFNKWFHPIKTHTSVFLTTTELYKLFKDASAGS